MPPVRPLTLLLISLAISAQAEVDFSRQILPILSDRCFQCHGPDPKERKGELRLDHEGDAKKDAIVPGKSAESEVMHRLLSTDPDELMPPAKLDRPLTKEQVELIRQWIDEGAKWGRHWAFNRVERLEVPAVRPHPIDAFIQTRLDHEGLKPEPEANRAVLIRRLSLDLTGLPPTPEETTAFLNDSAPGAWERLVDRVLASPTYGERMAWDWLDAARYADSNGYQGDSERTMWPWRDWVVDAFNQNMPWDEFTIQQLAGDLLPGTTPEQILATGFCRNHMINGEGGRIAEENRVDYVMDMAETAGTIWLGLTMTCSRCHDHKFDPITQKDYYSLFAFFNQTPVDGGGRNPQTPPLLEVPAPEQKAAHAVAQAKWDEARVALETVEKQKFGNPESLPEPVQDALKSKLDARRTSEWDEIAKHFGEIDKPYVQQLRQARSTRDARDKVNNEVPRVMVMKDQENYRASFILDRGLYTLPKEEVKAAVPSMFAPLKPGEKADRLALARWLVSRDNPLTARVTVNRFWQNIFGIGLVKTPENFGVQSEFPVHPELLDWLSAEWMESGWDVKHLLRVIVTSDAYKRSSHVAPGMAERDPDNRLLARGSRYRLPSWMIRDQALAVSGLISPKLGGTPVNGYQPPGIWEEATFGNKKYTQDRGESLYRRSLYTFWRRIIGPTLFFDNAARQVCTVKTLRTNTPMHALTTLNDVTYVEAARALAERVYQEAPSSDEARLRLAGRRVLTRDLSAEEAAIWQRSLERARAEFGQNPAEAEVFLAIGESKRVTAIAPVDHAALTAVCLAMLNLDEALTRE